MADETGGRAILGTLDFGPALAGVGQDLDTYYSLGYRLPPSDETDESRTVKIRVELDEPHVAVRYRKSLRSHSMSEELAGRTRAALMYDVVDNPLGVLLETGELQPMGSDVHVVPIRVSIPLGKITLLSREDVYRGQLELFLAGHDRNGRLAPVRTADIPIEIPAAEIETARVVIAAR